ncbi:FAD-dependent oxidoreductase [Streptomyces sp. ACT015]|uniref:FAD-dependent oxidoreductase n=1 Tax=Streptomyces sp. ACT015 TaxID=3134807 RepID=UPI003D173F68
MESTDTTTGTSPQAPTGAPASIAVVGAGPGGLLCALVLQRHGIDCTVYDADLSADSRDAGGTLDLHTDTGQIALADAGLLDAFLAVARADDQAKRHMDQHGTVHGVFEPEPGDSAAPEIDRGQLRALIAAHVDPARVRWGHKLTGADPLGAGRHRLTFANGATAEADLVIGADGVRSRVRRLVSPATPEYSGVAFLDVRYDDADRRHPALARLLGRGHLFARGDDGNAIIVQRNSNGMIRGYVALRTEADWAARAGIGEDDVPALRAFLLERFSGWSAELLPFLTDSDGYVRREISFLPTPLTWPHTPGATLLGDAAHAMGPFGGHGVNLALLDAAELARALAEEPTVEAAVRRYEPAMQSRAAAYAGPSNQATRGFFGVGGAPDDGMPDHAAEHRRYRRNAADYLRDRAVSGVWDVTFRAPDGARTAELALTVAHDGVSGTLDGRPLAHGSRDGAEIRFTAEVTSPSPTTLTCVMTVDGDTAEGTARHALGSTAFTGTRRPAA